MVTAATIWTSATVMTTGIMLAVAMMLTATAGAASAQDGTGDRAYRVVVEHTETGIAHAEDWRLLLREDGTVSALAFEDTDNQLSDRVRFFRAIARLDGNHDGSTFQAQGSVVGMVTLWAAEDSPGGVRLVECPIVEATVAWEGTVTDQVATVNHTATWDYRCIDDVGSAALDPAVGNVQVSLPRVDELPNDEFAFAPSVIGQTPSDETLGAGPGSDALTPPPGAPTPGGFGTGQPGDVTAGVAADAADPAGSAAVRSGLVAFGVIVGVVLAAVGVVIAVKLARGAGAAGVAAAAGGTAAAGAATPASAARPRSLARIVMLLAGLALWTLVVGGVVALAGGAAAFAHYVAMLAFVIFVGATVSTARAFRRSRAMSRRALLIMALLPLAMALLQIALNSHSRALAALVGLPLGAVAGAAWAWLTKVEADSDGGGIKIAGTIPALILWAGLIGLTQIIRLVGSDVPGLLLTVVVAQSTAFGVWGLVLLLRGTRKSNAPAAAPSPGEPQLAGSHGKESA